MYRNQFLTGTVYGLSVALLSGGMVALFTFLSGLGFKEALVLGAQIGALMIPTAIGACVLALIIKTPEEKEPEEELEVEEYDLGMGELEKEYPCEPLSPIDTAFERVVGCAWAQIEAVYKYNVTPTRKYITTHTGFNQIEWNSGRALLVALGVVTGQQWLEADSAETGLQLGELLERVRLDKHSDHAGIIFVPAASSRSYQRLPIAVPPINGSYLTAPPQQARNGQFLG